MRPNLLVEFVFSLYFSIAFFWSFLAAALSAIFLQWRARCLLMSIMSSWSAAVAVVVQ